MTTSGSLNETRFVLAAVNRGAADEDLRALADQVVDWSVVLEMSVSEGAQPTFARRLRSCHGLTLPAGVPGALDRIARITELRMEYVRQRLAEVLDDLGQVGIPVILLKGAALANWLYGSFGERYMSDLDLLVRPEDARPANDLLRSSGWKPRFKEQYDRLYDRMHHLMPLVDDRAPAMKLNAEIHTALIPLDRDPFLLSATDVWRDSRNIDGLPEHVRVPSPVHALWHSCVHYAWSHMFSRGIRTFQDVAILVRSGSIDWTAFVSEAKRTRAASCCYWTLFLARELAAVPIPDDVLHELEPRTSKSLRRLIARHLANEIIGGHGPCPSIRLRRLMWRAAIRPGKSGHGACRPWSEADWNGMLADHREFGEAPPSGGMQSARDITAWIRYMQSLLAREGIRETRPAA